METFSPGRVCIFLYVGEILVPSLRRWCSPEPVWGVKRMRPRNRGHQRSLGWVPSHTFLVLCDSMAKDCFIFQRLQALHFPLKLIRFANCLHVRKGGCNFLSAHGEGLRPGLCCRPPSARWGGGRGPWRAPGAATASGKHRVLAQCSLFYSKQVFAGFGVLI